VDAESQGSGHNGQHETAGTDYRSSGGPGNNASAECEDEAHGSHMHKRLLDGEAPDTQAG